MLPTLLPRSPEAVAVLAALAGLLWALARGWRDAGRGRALAACLPAARENAARYLLPLAESALRARRLLEKARDPQETGALEPGIAELLRVVRGLRSGPAGGGVVWLTSARAEVLVIRLWVVLEGRLEERLGADDLTLAAAGDEVGLERLRPPLRRWLRGEPGPDAELWLLGSLGEVLAAEIDRLAEGKVGMTRRELRALRRRLGPIPPGLPDGESLAEALGESLGGAPRVDTRG